MKVEWLTAAEDDLREIGRRVKLSFGRDAAERAIVSVVDEARRLADFPEIGRICSEYESSKHTYRALHTRHDRIVYTITGDCVLIVAVFDTRRDPAVMSALFRSRETLA